MPPPLRTPGRRSIRLRGYDYAAPGAYFVTICVHDRRRLFGHVARGRLCTNAPGATIRAVWDALPDRFPVVLDAFVVMPDHVHGILWITDDGGAGAPTGVGARRESMIAGAHEGRPYGTHAPVRAPLVGARREPDAPVRAPLVGARREPHAPVRAPLVGARLPPDARPADPPTLGDIIGAFKSLTTVAYFDGVRTAGWPRVDRRLWHRNYYERILGDADALGAVRRYIARNPERWVAGHRRRA